MSKIEGTGGTEGDYKKSSEPMDKLIDTFKNLDRSQSSSPNIKIQGDSVTASGGVKTLSSTPKDDVKPEAPTLPNPLNVGGPDGLDGVRTNTWYKNLYAALATLLKEWAVEQMKSKFKEAQYKAEQTGAVSKFAQAKAKTTIDIGAKARLQGILTAVISSLSAAVSIGGALNTGTAENRASKKIDAETAKMRKNPLYSDESALELKREREGLKAEIKGLRGEIDEVAARSPNSVELAAKEGQLKQKLDGLKEIENRGPYTKYTEAKAEKQIAYDKGDQEGIEKYTKLEEDYKPGVEDLKAELEYRESIGVEPAEIAEIRGLIPGKQEALNNREENRLKMVGEEVYKITQYTTMVVQPLTQLGQAVEGALKGHIEAEKALLDAKRQLEETSSTFASQGREAAQEHAKQFGDELSEVLQWLNRMAGYQTSAFRFTR